MDLNFTYSSLPFVDAEASDHSQNKKQEYVYDLHNNLPSNISLLGTDDGLAQFLTADGPLEEPDLNGPVTLHCEICKMKFDNAKKYYGHLRIHSKQNLWICDKCPSEKFSSKQNLMKHSLTHKPLAKIWRCPQCPMAFEALWRLQQHLFAKHLDYRPHKCEQCNKSFHKLSDLKKHQDIHTDVMKYACPNCTKQFKDSSNLKRHMVIHTKEKLFKCIGCQTRFTQLASLKRHLKSCATKAVENVTQHKTRRNHCRVCGMSFQYKSALLEHCVRQHFNTNNESEKSDKNNQTDNLDTNKTVDNIVDDILSAEDEYMTLSTLPPPPRLTNTMLNNYNPPEQYAEDKLMQFEFLKDMNTLHMTDEDMLYNDLDNMFNINLNDEYNMDKHSEILFDFTDGERSVDQDIMNALYQVKADHLPDDLLNIPDVSARVTEPAPISVNDCATIFESDVDLDASTNLAENLNQLIGENSVQYVSTEDDDMFIISLNSEIDAEQLTDMLNVGVEVVDGGNDVSDTINEMPDCKSSADLLQNNIQPIIIKLEGTRTEHSQEPPKDMVVVTKETYKAVEGGKTKTKSAQTFVCGTCDKVFKKKENYKSHLATHEASLRRHVCHVCGARFSYRSTLNKHTASAHVPLVSAAHACTLCARTFRAAWLLKHHTQRDHMGLTPHACQRCDRKFYKKCDLVVHMRYHTGERPYCCDICGQRFPQVSHLIRHTKFVDCTSRAKKKRDGQLL